MLLKTRSILAQAAILALIITLAKSQNYDSEYNVDEEAEDNSGYTGEGHEHPDYSKYFAVDGQNAAQIQGRADSGFVTPIEFSSFFGTPQFAFGESNNQETLKPITAETKQDDPKGFVSDKDFTGGFSAYNTDGFAGGAQDYFEQAQKQKKAEDEDDVESKPGPSYVSHRIAPKKAYKSEVEDIRHKPAKYQPLRNKNTEAEELEEVDEEEEQKQNFDLPEYTAEGFKPSPPLDLAQFQPTNPSQILEAAANLNNLPINPEYYKKYANTVAQVTPYQKYSFQPAPAATNYGLKEASILNAFQSTAAPFNPSYGKVASTAATNYEYQPSEVVSQNLKNKDCIKVNKEVSDKSGKFTKQPMHCYVCKDPKSGAKYEQCSYSSEPTPKSYYQTTSKSYGNRSPEPYRNKRDESESYADPYEEIKAKSHSYYSKPDQFEKDYYKAPDFSNISEEYNYNPETLNDKEAEEKSYSEIQSEALVKQGDSCKKSHKNGVTCMVCKNAKTGANYEQCSYESAPNEKKYAYVRESKYDGEGNPIDEKVVDSTNPKADVSEDSEKFGQIRRSDNAENSDDESEQSEESQKSENQEQEDDSSRSSKLINDEPYDVPSHFSESNAKLQKAGVGRLDPELYGSSDSSEKAEDEEDDSGPQKFTNLDEYHLKLFPQFSNQETKREETRAQPDNPYFEDLSGKKDVEKVLEEFTKKDRSNCKQIRKKGMTCYLCVDKKGIQQEECMYVSESRPQSSHVAYHEVQHIKVPEKPNVTESESQINPVEVSAEESQKRKKFFKKATSPLAEDSEANASTNVETRIKFTPAVAASTNTYKKLPKNKRNTKSKDNKKRENSKSEELEDPKPEFDVNDEGGLYSAETAPVYSKALGLTLPRYMLEKSPLEAEFDRSVDSGN